MKSELLCPMIYQGKAAVGYGGNQEWFHGTFQRKAGCGSVTGANMAAYYAVIEGYDTLYQGQHQPFLFQDYLKHMEAMYSYMTPGFMGYPLAGRFAKDFKKFTADRGVVFVSEVLFMPRKQEESVAFIRSAIDSKNPVALLILRHPARELMEDNWHWVTVTGYDDERKELIWSNCGERETISWNVIFDEAVKYTIAMVRFQKEIQ